MVISQNGAGHLQIHVDWPSSLRNKGVFFVKRDAEPLPEGDGIDLSDFLACGDIHPNVLGKLWYLCLYSYVSLGKLPKTSRGGGSLNLAAFGRKVLAPPRCLAKTMYPP